MVVERRLSILISAAVAFVLLTALWNAFVRPAHPVRAGPAADAPLVPVPAETSAAARDSAARATSPAPAPAPAPAPTPAAAAPPPPLATGPGGDAAGPSYMVLLARSEIRRRIRASAGLTYLNDIVAASSDSGLHRWDNRMARPVRVYLTAGTVANFQPAFLDAVRSAFQGWEQAGVPVRFALDADSASAEVRFQWRIQFEGERTGQTDLEWDADGGLTSGVVTLATFDPKGQPLTPDDLRVMAMHEIGHLIGLDHSHDPGDLMYAAPKVRELSPRDIATALLLYQLAPGTLRAGG
jgi:Matrixin